MTRIGVIVLILGLSIPLNAQMFEQVYPEFEIAEVHDGLQWNADTFFVCGFGQMLLRTTDAGRTWTNEMAGRRDWSFYRMERTTKYVYMLAEPTVFWRDSLPKGHLTALLRYDPRSGSFDVASFPKMPAADSEWTQIHDIAVAGSTFFLLQGNRETGLVLHRSTDEGSTWNRVPLPDSVELGRRASITCFDDSRFAVVSDVHGRGNHVHFTHDGGEHWFFDSTLIVSGSDTEFGKFTLMWLTAADVIASRPDGTIACSSDGGVHWTERSFAPCDVAGILAVSPDRGYVIGKHEEVFRSDDGFRSFVPLRPSDTG
ncbi:MAG: hypothetical protein JXA28_14805, partial [Bacteroidetes bacterium]|nr:hypothetical protein [Bacteroidota bacterium]